MIKRMHVIYTNMLAYILLETSCPCKYKGKCMPKIENNGAHSKKTILVLSNKLTLESYTMRREFIVRFTILRIQV